MCSGATIIRFIVAAAFLQTLSCTIIQDGDVTSSEELSKLKLKGFTIVQQTSKGNASTIATFLYDSVVNTTDVATGAKITRKLRFTMPAIGTLKMKFKSGLNSKADFFVSYMDDGQPYNCRILVGDSTVEQYRFRYDSYTSSSRKVNKLVTILDPIDNKPATYSTNDVFNYTTTNITSISRTPQTGSPSTIPISYGGSGAGLSVSNVASSYQQQSGNCGNGASFDTCVGYSSNSSFYTISFVQSPYSLSQVLIEDNRSTGQSGAARDFDTYFFHPLMLLRNQVSQGKYLLAIYMIDWWQPGLSSTNQPNQVETVTINLNYGR